MKKIVLIIVTIFLQGCSVFGIRTVEILEYTILEKEEDFDIRQYEDYWVARTESEGEYDQSTNQAFNRLFKYISGENTQQEKIAMTGPVLQREKGEKIAMTGPVFQQKQGESWIMEFVLPSKYNQGKPPEPTDPQVIVVKEPGFKAAALRYSGNLNEEKFNAKTKILMEIIKQKGLQPVGEVFSAGYDPPWTLPFLKRNEVLIMIE